MLSRITLVQTLLDFSTSSSWILPTCMSQAADGRGWIPTKSLEHGEKLEGCECVKAGYNVLLVVKLDTIQ